MGLRYHSFIWIDLGRMAQAIFFLVNTAVNGVANTYLGDSIHLSQIKTFEIIFE